MQDYNQICEVTSAVAKKVIDDYCERAEREPGRDCPDFENCPEEYKHLFLAKEEDGTWTAIDNRDGNAWTENFKNECIARRWLLDELCFDEAYSLDNKRKYIATCTKAGEHNNFAPGIEAVTHYDIFLEGGKLYTEDHPTGAVRRYGYNPPATQSEAKTIADVIMHCGIDKRWTVRAYQ